MKSSFVNMVSHELRTPLSIIQSGAEIIEMMIDANLNDPAPIKEQASRIAQEVTATTAMLNELLLVSKIEAGKIDYKPQETDIALFVLGLLEEYFMPYKDGRMVQLQVKGTPRFGKLDKMIMQHIIINLLDNAFKYSPGAPPPTLRLHFQQSQWTLLVKDNGIGIPAKDMDNLFAAFARASNVGEIHGTGLGLVIIKYMTINHGGYFAIKSKEGAGTLALIGFNYK
jgi:signal transduction histidine kinase